MCEPVWSPTPFNPLYDDLSRLDVGSEPKEFEKGFITQILASEAVLDSRELSQEQSFGWFH